MTYASFEKYISNATHQSALSVFKTYYVALTFSFRSTLLHLLDQFRDLLIKTEHEDPVVHKHVVNKTASHS